MRHSGLKLWRAIGLSVGLMVLLGSDFVSVASASGFRHKDDWIYNASNQIQTNFPRVDAIMWFHQDKSSNPNDRNWRVDTDPNALQAYRNSWQGIDQGVFLAEFPPDTSAIDDFETLVGVHQVRIGWFESLDKPFPLQSIEAVQARGSIPYIILEPFDAYLGDSARSGPSRLDDILAGSYDTRLNEWAQAAATNGGPIEITFGHEMNGDWFTWGYVNGHNGNTPQDFIDAFRYVVDVFRDAGADNVSWVWTINASWTDDFSVAFPGEDYVDRMGMNGFNWGDFPKGTHQPWEADFYRDWRDFEEIFGQWDPYNPNGVHNYNRLCELDPDAPIIIGEFASTPEPATAAFLVLGATGLLFQRRRWS